VCACACSAITDLFNSSVPSNASSLYGGLGVRTRTRPIVADDDNLASSSFTEVLPPLINDDGFTGLDIDGSAASASASGELSADAGAQTKFQVLVAVSAAGAAVLAVTMLLVLKRLRKSRRQQHGIIDGGTLRASPTAVSAPVARDRSTTHTGTRPPPMRGHLVDGPYSLNAVMTSLTASRPERTDAKPSNGSELLSSAQPSSDADDTIETSASLPGSTQSDYSARSTSAAVATASARPGNRVGRRAKKPNDKKAHSHRRHTSAKKE
jgi:hypothetical protein